MEINATLIGQMVAFAIFVWFTMKFVWPSLSEAMRARQDKISDGLAAAERGRKDLDEANSQVSDLLKEARQKANEILDQANKRSNEVILEAKTTARAEGERQLAAAQAQIELELNQVKKDLRERVVALAISGATKVLEREVDAKAHNDLLKDLAKQL